jgi:dTDP-4-dehydrorhamnose reductase
MILGAQGLLGTALAQVFQDCQPILLDRAEVDISDRRMLAKLIETHRPGLLINAAAYTNVDGAESEPDLAQAVNGWAIRGLARLARDYEIPLVHYSTDYIFDGQSGLGYPEDAADFQPINAYGYSKLLGEEALWQCDAAYFIIRTSSLFGPDGKNFVTTILRKALAGEPLRVVNDQSSCPTYSYDLARQTRLLVSAGFPFGTYHITNAGVTSWFDFAREILDQAGLETPLQPCRTGEYPTPAKRPAYSCLINTKLPPLRSWQMALSDYIAEWRKKLGTHPE